MPMQLDDRCLIIRLLEPISKTVKIGFICAFLLISISCIWYRVSSALICDQNGAPVNYRLYRSIWGNLYLENRLGVITMIYPVFSSVTCPESDAPLFHSDSFLILDPIRSLFPGDMPLALSFDPHLKTGDSEVILSIQEKERIKIKY
jgi:hypothetical protein